MRKFCLYGRWQQSSSTFTYWQQISNFYASDKMCFIFDNHIYCDLFLEFIGWDSFSQVCNISNIGQCKAPNQKVMNIAQIPKDLSCLDCQLACYWNIWFSTNMFCFMEFMLIEDKGKKFIELGLAPIKCSKLFGFLHFKFCQVPNKLHVTNLWWKYFKYLIFALKLCFFIWH